MLLSPVPEPPRVSRTDKLDGSTATTVVEEPVGGARIDAVTDEDGSVRYRFEAPAHCGKTFDDLEAAKRYADVYVSVGGFCEEGSGEVGVPAGLVQAGTDAMAVYLLSLPATSREWVRSFYGVSDEELDDYLEWVRGRADERRERARDAAAE